jgi:3'-phosphoadenosine 5'-phosphosulfate sulfotransferase
MRALNLITYEAKFMCACLIKHQIMKAYGAGGTSLGGPQSGSGRCGEQKLLLPQPIIQPLFLGRHSYSLVAVPTELQTSFNFVRFQVFTAVTMKNARLLGCGAV